MIVTRSVEISSSAVDQTLPQKSEITLPRTRGSSEGIEVASGLSEERREREEGRVPAISLPRLKRSAPLRSLWPTSSSTSARG